MSLFINNNSGPIYNNCAVTINNGHTTVEPEKRPAPQAEEIIPAEQATSSNYKPPYPREGDYNSVREYVEERKKYDAVFLEYCKTHNRTQLCNRLTDEFGWDVKVDSYGKNVNRNL